MAEFGTLNFSVAFNPTSAFPLDARYYFDSLESAQAAAAAAVEVGSADGTYHYGENVAVVEDGAAKLYIIQPNKTLTEVGSATLGDDKSITLSEGVLSLKNFGVKYWAYQAGEDGAPGTYVETSGWTAPLEPKVRLVSEGVYELAWYQPNPTTVEGLQSAISDLQATVGNMYQKTDVYNKTEIDAMLEWGTIE